MRFYRKIAIALACSLHFSVCTGGIMSTTVALAADFAPETDVYEVTMSPFIPDVFLCATSTPEISVPVVQDDAPQPLECDSGDYCFQSASQTNQDRSFISFLQQELVLSASAVSEFSQEPLSLQHITRDGPLYEQSLLIARVLVKRE